jgi:glycosyltransferase involved in cell wall biosynthesis
MIKLPPLSASPLVSVIIPSYNQGRFISETIESILSQSYRPLEILVIDGASTDETVHVLRRYDNTPELRWWSEPDSGVVEAVNKGFKRAQGEICAIQSSDDLYVPGAVRRGVEELVTDSTLSFVFGDIIKIDADGNEISRTNLEQFSLENVLSIQTWVPQPSTFFRMDLAKLLGGWHEEISYAADTELWLRMAFRAKAKKLDVMMAKRRVHDQQRDKQGERIIRDYSRMIDSLTELKQAPKRLKRAAAAGKLLQANRYSRDDSYWIKLWRQWRAVLLSPSLRKRIPFGSLLPGWYPARAFAIHLKRMALGGG